MTFTYYFWYTFSKIMARVFFDFRVIHRERILEEGPVIFASNHQSYFDPPLVGICSQRAIYALARKTLFSLPLLGSLFPRINVIPVDRDGNDMSALKTIIRLIRAGNGVMLFPEGTRSLDGKLQPGKPGVGLIVAKTRAPVQPMRIFGAYEAFPKKSTRGSGKITLSPISMVVGEPIRFTDAELTASTHGGDERVMYQYLSNRVMTAIGELPLPDALPLSREGAKL